MANDKKCEMVLGEDGDLNYFWECSACGKVFKDTRKFEKSENCPVCQANIVGWVGLDEEPTIKHDGG